MGKKKVFGIVIAASLLLVGCGKTDNNSKNYDFSENSIADNSSTNSNPTPTPTGNWSADELKIFADYFYGVSVPFMDINGATALTYDEEMEYATKSAPNCSAAILESYGKLFDDTWLDYGTAGTPSAAEVGYYYNFEKVIKTANGDRYVSVYMFGGEFDEDYQDYAPTLDGSGTFIMQIYDPYYYEWPADIVEAVTGYVFGCEDTVPAFNGADYYEPELGYLDYGQFAIYCYTENANSQAEYARTLTAAGYTADGQDEYGYDVYVSPSNELVVSIAYDPDYQDLDIYVALNGGGEGDYETSWPTDEINDLVKNGLGSNETVPAYNGGWAYQLAVDDIEVDGYFAIFVYTDDTNAQAAYANTLKNAGYTYYKMDDMGYECYYSPNKTLSVEIAYDADWEDLDIYVCAAEGGQGGGGEIIDPTGTVDTLTAGTLGLTKQTTYVDFNYTSNVTGVKYNGVASLNYDAIQLREKNSDSGILVTSNYNCNSISFTINTNTYSDRQILIFASNSPISMSDMYGSTQPVTTIAVNVSSKGTTYSYAFTSDYKYIGIRVGGGAVYMDSIVFDWDI